MQSIPRVAGSLRFPGFDENPASRLWRQVQVLSQPFQLRRLARGNDMICEGGFNLCAKQIFQREHIIDSQRLVLLRRLTCFPPAFQRNSL